MKNTRGVRHRTGIAIVGSAIFFLVPFAFIFLIASIDRDAGEPAAVLLAAALRPAGQPRAGRRRRATT